jgi:hypothetical protein
VWEGGTGRGRGWNRNLQQVLKSFAAQSHRGRVGERMGRLLSFFLSSPVPGAMLGCEGADAELWTAAGTGW